ncbi:MAG: hypothetical protein LBK99_06725 [Opitutaceae bacterium]|nr:hypothetical protein [Opitutaceae bacterium]
MTTNPAPSPDNPPAGSGAWPLKRLILCPQDKGGIGKSFIVTLLYDYLLDHDVNVRAFDLDHANSTFSRYVPEAEFIDTDVDADKLGVLDRLIEALGQADVALADSRAAGGIKIRQYLEESRIVEMQPELDLLIVFLLVAVDDKDANSQIADLLDTWGDRVRWLVARNLRDGEHLDLYMASNSRQTLAGFGAVEIDVPCLAEITRNRLQRANLTVGRGRLAETLHLLDCSRCVRFHDRMAAEFGKAGRLLVP